MATRAQSPNAALPQPCRSRTTRRRLRHAQPLPNPMPAGRGRAGARTSRGRCRARGWNFTHTRLVRWSSSGGGGGGRSGSRRRLGRRRRRRLGLGGCHCGVAAALCGRHPRSPTCVAPRCCLVAVALHPGALRKRALRALHAQPGRTGAAVTPWPAHFPKKDNARRAKASKAGTAPPRRRAPRTCAAMSVLEAMGVSSSECGYCHGPGQSSISRGALACPLLAPLPPHARTRQACGRTA